jgi:hypothetical protein
VTTSVSAGALGDGLGARTAPGAEIGCSCSRPSRAGWPPPWLSWSRRGSSNASAPGCRSSRASPVPRRCSCPSGSAPLLASTAGFVSGLHLSLVIAALVAVLAAAAGTRLTTLHLGQEQP